MDAIFGIFRALGEIISVCCRVLVIILEFVKEISQHSNSGTVQSQPSNYTSINASPRKSNTAPSHTTNYNAGVPGLMIAQCTEGLFEVYTNQKDRRVWVVSIDRKNTYNSYFKIRVKIRMNGDSQDKYYTYEFKLFNNNWAYLTAKGGWAPVEGTVTASGILMGLYQYLKVTNCI